MAKTWCKRVKVVFADDATIFFLQDALFQRDCEIFVCLSFFFLLKARLSALNLDMYLHKVGLAYTILFMALWSKTSKKSVKT